jgi:hypothetical protein
VYKYGREALITKFRPVAEMKLREAEPMTIDEVKDYSQDVLSQNRKLTSVVLDLQDAIQERMMDPEVTLEALGEMIWLGKLLEKAMDAYKANVSMLSWCTLKRSQLATNDVLDKLDPGKDN